jgi:NADH:ubiquinone oxidoreductase subunit H
MISYELILSSAVLILVIMAGTFNYDEFANIQQNI